MEAIYFGSKEQMADWVNPKYKDVVEGIRDIEAKQELGGSMADCTNCRGVGKIIYIDEGKIKDIPCPACKGSGEK